MTFWKFLEYRAIEGAMVVGLIFFLLLVAALIAVLVRGWKHRG